MKLKAMRIRNFRCYKEEVEIVFEDFTAFIGRNDAGKSTILEALDIFLNEKTPDKDDAAKGGQANDLTIICEFSDFPETIVIDDEASTSLRDEWLLNEKGMLEIHKTYNGSLDKPKLISIKVRAIHPTATGTEDLTSLKNADLKKRAGDLGISLQGVNQSINADIRKRIRDSHTNLYPASRQILLDVDGNSKKVWAGINAHMPTFALFKSDRASSDQDPEAQDPLKLAVKEAIRAKTEELREISEHIESEVRRIAELTLRKLREMDPTLATQLNPQITTKKWDSLFSVSITGDENVPINKRGSGAKRLVLLNFFRAKVEQASSEKPGAPVIYAIEEPETSQHPRNQRLLVSALTELSGDHQVIITTHTPMLARTFPEQSLRYVKIGEDGRSREILHVDGSNKDEIAKSLGVLPDNAVKIFIGVEGKHDINFLKNISKVLVESGEPVLDLEKMEFEGELIFIPLGGSSLALWVSRLRELNKPEFYIFDRDHSPPAQPKYIQQQNEINVRDNCKALNTCKREMENYIHFDAINRVYESHGIHLNLTRNFGDFDDVPEAVAELVHNLSGSPTAWVSLDPDTKGKKASRVKGMLNGEAAKLMTSELLNDIDKSDSVRGWFAQLKRMITT